VGDTVDALIVDLLQWVSSRERTYEEVMSAWRTSCPRLPVWEDANERGFVVTEATDDKTLVRITAAGKAFLDQRKRSTC
jgi:hypothetical protein